MCEVLPANYKSSQAVLGWGEIFDVCDVVVCSWRDLDNIENAPNVAQGINQSTLVTYRFFDRC